MPETDLATAEDAKIAIAASMPTLKRAAPFLLSVATLVVFLAIGRQHALGGYGTETDFYLYFAPDAARISAGHFPESTYHGPGYALLLAAVEPLAGDFFEAAKWISAASFALIVLLTAMLFSRFGAWTGIAAAALVAVSGRLPQYAIVASTDVVYTALILAAIVVLLAGRWRPQTRAIAAGAFAGYAFLTRYNAVSLIVAIVIGIVVLDVFEQSRDARLRLAGFFVLAVVLVTSPWLVANGIHHGSPLFNTNYLNAGKQLHPSVAAGYTGDDALLRASRVFHSFGDVIRYEPGEAAREYLRSLVMHVRGTWTNAVAGAGVAWLALIGAVFAWRRRSKMLSLLLIALAAHFALLALVHWEARFHFFVSVVYAGLAVCAVTATCDWAKKRGLMSQRGATTAALLAFVTLWSLSLAASLPYVRRHLATEPVEIAEACTALQKMRVPHARILARKPHLPYRCGAELVMFPQVHSTAELRTWLEQNEVDVVFFALPEAATRRELASLLDPRRAPPWLVPVWASPDRPAVLYRPAVR